MKKPGLALFDFDGTISSKDSFAEFLKYSFSYPRLILSSLVLMPVLIQYVLGFMKNETAKEKVFNHFYGGMSENEFLKLSEKFHHEILDSIIRNNALKRLEWHRSENHELCIVSASFEPLLNNWSKKQKMNMLCTKIEIKNGRVTGKFNSPNCYGIEKANRIKAEYNLEEFETIFAYGDSPKGDGEMFKLSNKPYLNYF